MNYGKLELVHGGKKPEWDIEVVPYVATKLKRLLPRVEASRRGVITVADTPEVSRELDWVMTRWPLEMSAADRAHLEAQRDEHIRREEIITSVLEGTAPPLRYEREAAGEPYEFQEVAARIIYENRRLLLTDELGLGKTLSALLLLRHPEALPMVVVAPAHLPNQWLRELAQWFPDLAGHIARTTAVYDPAQHRSMQGRSPDVFLVTYSKLSGWADELRGVARSVVFEEAHELRVPNSQKYTAAGMLADSMEWVVGLTATPVFNYGDEIHSVMDVIRPDLLGTRSEFTREWCSFGGRKSKVTDPRALGSYLREQGAMLRRTRKDVKAELPPIVPITQLVDCDVEVLDDLSAEVERLADVLLSRDEHVTGLERRDAAGDLDWKMREATGIAKAPHVAAHVRLMLQSEEKMILFGWHRAVYEIWLKRLAEFEPALYTGSESARQKELSLARFLGGERLEAFNWADHKAGRLKAWEEHSESRLLIMSLRSGSGVDGLQHVCHVAGIGELDWSPGVEKQCVGRLDRPGQTEPVVAVTFVASDGSDPVVREVQTEKRQQAELISDPDAELFAAVGNDDRMRQLARYVKERAGRTKVSV
jgi:SNF2 family DNA or RNA helicase